MHVRGKRRAPVPPNPFGDPDGPDPPSKTTNKRSLNPFEEDEDEEDTNTGLPAPSLSQQDEDEEIAQNVRNAKQEAGNSKPNENNANVVDKSDSKSAQEELRTLEATMNSLQAHEKRINDEVKAQLALLKKESRMSCVSSGGGMITESNGSGTFLYAKTKKEHHKEQQDNHNHTAAAEGSGSGSVAGRSPTKISPRPWYKRSSSKSPKKSPKPLTLLAKISDLDREAVRIIAENRRRSAEKAYNATAKELITMFSNTFTPNGEEVIPEVPTSLIGAGEFASGTATASVSISIGNQDGASQAQTTPVSAGNKLPHIYTVTTASASAISASATPEDQKKCAIVQPQAKARIDKPTSPPLLNSNETTSILAQYSRNPGPSEHLFSSNSGEEWSCPRCTLKNAHWRALCDACYFRKDSPLPLIPVPVTMRPLASTSAQIQIQTVPLPLTPPKPNAIPPMRMSDERTPQVLPPCENFLSQLPLKESCTKEEKLMGMKLFDDPEVEELDIEKLRQARVAFFTKYQNDSGLDFKPNNLNPSSAEEDQDDWNPANANSKDQNQKATADTINCNNVFEEDADEDNKYDTIETVARIHQLLNPNTSGYGPGTWKPLQVHRFRPMLESILEGSNNGGNNGREAEGQGHAQGQRAVVPPIYENWEFKLSELERKPSWTKTFMQNVQMEIKDQIRYFDSFNPSYDSEDFLSDSDLGDLETSYNGAEVMGDRARGRRWRDEQEPSVEDYRRLGAIPKHLHQNQRNGNGLPPGSSQSHAHAQGLGEMESQRRRRRSERRADEPQTQTTGNQKSFQVYVMGVPTVIMLAP
jgi:hypothetical protein